MPTRPTEVRLSDTVTLVPNAPPELTASPDGVHVLRPVNDERAVVVLVVKGGRLEIWLRLP